MKFFYADESGEKEHSKFFVMCGVMVDAVRLRKRTEDLDDLWEGLFAEHPDHPTEIKTSRMINGKGGWSKIKPDRRKSFVSDVITLATESGGKVFCIPVDLHKLDEAREIDFNLPFAKDKWTYSAMFLACLVQKKMQAVKGKKGLTVFVIDDNQAGMPSLSNELHNCNPWFDGLYALPTKKRGKTTWKPRTDDDRFDHIVNTAFAITSHHSTFVQVADVIAYVYRRHFEIQRDGEAFPGEAQQYGDWFSKLEVARVALGKTQPCAAFNFYKHIVPKGWKL